MFYKTAYVNIGSIVEALLYEYVLECLQKKDTNKVKRYCKNIVYIEQQVTKGYFIDNFVICEKKENNIEFKDDISFQSLINWVKDYKLLSEKVINYLNEIREKRNIVHWKVLLNFKNGWNELNDLAEMIDKYLEIFDEIKNRFEKL